jgi:hypothetical protein
MSEETYVELVPDDIELVQASEIDGTIFAIKSNFFYYFLKFAQKTKLQIRNLLFPFLMSVTTTTTATATATTTTTKI